MDKTEQTPGTKREIQWSAAIQAILASGSISKASKTLKVSRTTMYRWLNDPVFYERLRVASEQSVAQAITLLKGQSIRAAEVLGEMVDDAEVSPSARVAASKLVLDYASGMVVLEDLKRQMQAMQQEIAALKTSR
jgi:hypothetical protein